jgi:hypothetical protein
MTYEILMRADGVRAIKCLRCNAVSHNPNDVKELYCGNCHGFHEPRQYVGGVDEGERQVLLLALAELALSRPGWDTMLREIAEKFGGVPLFESFKRTSADRVKAERAPL